MIHGYFGITRNLLACGTGSSRVAHPSVEPFSRWPYPRRSCFVSKAAGQNSPDIESAGICRVNHLAAAPRVAAVVRRRILLHDVRSATLVRIEGQMNCVWGRRTRMNLGSKIDKQAQRETESKRPPMMIVRVKEREVKVGPLYIRSKGVFVQSGSHFGRRLSVSPNDDSSNSIICKVTNSSI